MTYRYPLPAHVSPPPCFRGAAACLRIIRHALLLLAGFFVAFAGAAEPVEYHVGITAFRDRDLTRREWAPTMDYLSSQVPNARFIAEPLTLPEFESGLTKHRIDFVITNPQHYIIMEAKFGISRIATLMKREEGQLLNQFGGVIVVRADRQDLQQAGDLRGKRIASVDKLSFAGYLLQYDLLKRYGVDIARQASISFLGFPQDLVVKAVLSGEADAGFVRTGVLEAMVREGKMATGAVRVMKLGAVEEFPFQLSTPLYPEWPFAAAPTVPVEVTNRVAAALLTMSPDSEAARAGRYERWSTPLEYQSVQSLMRRHRLYPYDMPEPISLTDIVRQYALPLSLLLSGIALLLAVMYIRAARLNHALNESRHRLSEMAHHDALTGLPNRNLLDHDLDKALAFAQRTHQPLAVGLIDLDGFKPINDTWGHDVGDAVLREVARRLTDSLRAGDTVARWGGDEFVLVLSQMGDAAQLEEIMARLLAALTAPLACCPEARVSASIGVSISNGDRIPAAELLRRADEAMYRAKRAGGSRFLLWAPMPCNEAVPAGSVGTVISASAGH